MTFFQHSTVFFIDARISIDDVIPNTVVFVGIAIMNLNMDRKNSCTPVYIQMSVVCY